MFGFTIKNRFRTNDDEWRKWRVISAIYVKTKFDAWAVRSYAPALLCNFSLNKYHFIYMRNDWKRRNIYFASMSTHQTYSTQFFESIFATIAISFEATKLHHSVEFRVRLISIRMARTLTLFHSYLNDFAQIPQPNDLNISYTSLSCCLRKWTPSIRQSIYAFLVIS